MTRSIGVRAAVAVASLLVAGPALAQPDPLPSWNDGPARRAILALVRNTTDPASPAFVRPEERLATFDRDGTLRVEQPAYAQLAFALARVVELAPNHPEWRTKAPFAAVLRGGREAGKPENIHLFTGRRPQAAFGNSTGDRQMLEFAQGGGPAALCMLVLHDDGAREYAYGPARGLPASKIGTFTQQLHDEAGRRGWVVVSMKEDWKTVFAFEP